MTEIERDVEILLRSLKSNKRDDEVAGQEALTRLIAGFAINLDRIATALERIADGR